MSRMSKIGVFGSAYGESDPKTLEKSRETGIHIARLGHTVITGGCRGVPYEALSSAYQNGGKTIAYSPATDIDEHKKFGYPSGNTSEFVFIPKGYKYRGNRAICAKYRNVSSVTACDAAIFISGKMGALNEFTIAYDTGKVIGVLEGTGGITDHLKKLIESLNKKTIAVIIYSKDPKELVTKVHGILAREG